ncbi:MAG: hypothetical protein ABR579_05890 [Actinomycetota bacterium]
MALALLIALAHYFGYLRAAVAVVLFLAIAWLGLSYFRAAGEVPPDPEAENVSSSELHYVCTMCGLELKVEVSTTGRAPTHCREPMVLVSSEGKPPLRPVD